MTEPRHPFDQTLISGYLDGELTQGEAQRVRLHLEDCSECSELADEIRTLKEAAVTSEFQVPEDTQWDETPTNAFSRLIRNFGWALAVAWAIGTVAYLIWLAVTEDEDLVARLIVLAVWLGFGLVVLSAFIDRLKTRKTDRYRKVTK